MTKLTGSDAVRFLHQATFGPTAKSLKELTGMEVEDWFIKQKALKASRFSAALDFTAQQTECYQLMVEAPDQMRQRMVYFLSQLFVVSASKNNGKGELSSWLNVLSDNAFGNFADLLKKITLDAAMGKFLDLAESKGAKPNQNYARELLQLFTLGTEKLEINGNSVGGSPYSQTDVEEMAKALSGWGFKKNGDAIDFDHPLVEIQNEHNKYQKSIFGTALAANNTAEQDLDEVIKILMAHENVAPFISIRMIRHFVTSNPSAKYIKDVAEIFISRNGNLADTLQAVLLHAEARPDLTTDMAKLHGRLKDPVLHTMGLMRALPPLLDAQGNEVKKITNPIAIIGDLTRCGMNLLNAPSVFNFFSPMHKVEVEDAAKKIFAPEFQILSPALAWCRGGFAYNLLAHTYEKILKYNREIFENAHGINLDDIALIQAVNQHLMFETMSDDLKLIIEAALQVNKGSDGPPERALIALTLCALSPEYMIAQ